VDDHPGEDGVADPDEIIKVEMSCAEAKLNNSLKQVTHHVLIDNPKNILYPAGMPSEKSTCSFGLDDNLTMKDSYIRARYEQELEIPLTGKYELCDMQL